jgi:hypothetical protein
MIIKWYNRVLLLIDQIIDNKGNVRAKWRSRWEEMMLPQSFRVLRLAAA